MADIRIKDLPTTATQTASDDFIALDGTVNGTRKIDASAPSFKTSVTSPSVVAPTTTNLTLAGGSTGASLVLLQGANGAINITSNGSGSVNVNPGSTGSVNINSASGVGKLAVRTGTNENAHFRTATAIGGTGVGLDMLNDASGATVGFTLRSSATRLTGGNVTVPDGNLLIGATIDGGQKLQVNGTASFAGAVTTGSTLTVGANLEMPASSSIRFNSGTGLIYTGGYSYALSLQGSQLNLNTLSNAPITTGTGLATFAGDIAGKKIVLDVLGEQLTMTRTGVGTAVLAVGGSAELYGKAASYAFYNAAGSSAYLTIASSAAATFAGAVTVTAAATTAGLRVDNQTGGGGTAQYYENYTAGATTIARTLRGNGLSGYSTNGLNIDNYGGFQIGLNALGGSGEPFVIRSAGTTNLLTIASTGAATFAGAVAINNTVATAVAVASTHKVTIVIGGVTYYLLASNV